MKLTYEDSTILKRYTNKQEHELVNESLDPTHRFSIIVCIRIRIRPGGKTTVQVRLHEIDDDEDANRSQVPSHRFNLTLQRRDRFRSINKYRER